MEAGNIWVPDESPKGFSGGTDGISVDQFLSIAERCKQDQIDAGVGYQGGKRGTVPIDFEASVKGHTIDCSSFVMYVLNKAGFIPDGTVTDKKCAAQTLRPYLRDELHFTEISDQNQFANGDIIVTDRHTYIVKEVNADKTGCTAYEIFAGSGLTTLVTNQPFGIENGKAYRPPFGTGQPINSNGEEEEEEKEFEGYRGSGAPEEDEDSANSNATGSNNNTTGNNSQISQDNSNNNTQNNSDENNTEEEGEPEYVIAPATGKVLKYGTITRKNLVTGNDEEVGYIKIKLLEEKLGDYKKGECNAFVRNHKTIEPVGENDKFSPSEWLEDNYSEDELKVLGYDYFWQEYYNDGLNGTVLYLEGFDISDVLGDNQESSAGTIQALYDYIMPADDADAPPNGYATGYVIPNLLDNTKEAQIKVEEEAKKQAAYAYTDTNGDIYIKEGAVIGKTYSSDPEKNGGITVEKEYDVLDLESITGGTTVENNADTEQNKNDENKSESNNDTTTNEQNTENSNVIAPEDLPTKKEKFNVGNYMRIMLRDTHDEVIEDVEEYIEKKVASKSGVYGDLEAIDENSTDVEKVRAMATYFVEDQGCTIEAACGIIGNAIQECGLKLGLTDGKSVGLFQWKLQYYPGIDTWCADQGYDWETSFAGQTRLMMEAQSSNESFTMPGGWDEFKKLTDVEQAAEAFCVYYEKCTGGKDATVWYKPGSLYQDLNKRKKFAQNAYEIYANGNDSIGIKDGD